jgi:hypothetical protein
MVKRYIIHDYNGRLAQVAPQYLRSFLNKVLKNSYISRAFEQLRKHNTILSICRKDLISLGRWILDTYKAVAPIGDQLIRLKPILFSHPESST